MNLRFQLYLVGEAAAAGVAGDRGPCTRRQELGLGVQRLRTGLVIIVILLLGDLAHRVQAVSVQDSVALEPSDREDHLVPDM